MIILWIVGHSCNRFTSDFRFSAYTSSSLKLLCCIIRNSDITHTHTSKTGTGISCNVRKYTTRLSYVWNYPLLLLNPRWISLTKKGLSSDNKESTIYNFVFNVSRPLSTRATPPEEAVTSRFENSAVEVFKQFWAVFGRSTSDIYVNCLIGVSPNSCRKIARFQYF